MENGTKVGFQNGKITLPNGNKKEVILVTGGSGYLGLHLIEALAKGFSSQYDVAYTYQSHPPSPELHQKLPNVHSFQVDLRTGRGLDIISSTLGHPRVVVNCGALSVPRMCEQDPEAAMAINIPRSVVEWLLSQDMSIPPLLIHLSSDQVYEGDKSFYKEEDETKPVNVYGKSKVASENYVKSNYSNYAILRSSIIYGPQPVVPVPKSLPLQWIDRVLSTGDGEGEFLVNEFRCPIFVTDVVRVVELLIAKHADGGMKLVLNLGGPDRLSRSDMADIVAQVRGYKMELVNRVSTLSMDRGVVSPVDTSMDVTKLVAVLGITLTDFATGIALTFNDKTSVLPKKIETTQLTTTNDDNNNNITNS
jgi:dTDP-4-dehydrorhamnose reductase